MRAVGEQAPGSVVHSEPNPAPNRFRTPDRGTEPNPDTARREPNRTRTPRGGTEPNPDTETETEPNRTSPSPVILSIDRLDVKDVGSCWKLLTSGLLTSDVTLICLILLIIHTCHMERTNARQLERSTMQRRLQVTIGRSRASWRSRQARMGRGI